MFALYQAMEEGGRWYVVTVLLLLLVWETAHPFFGFFRRRGGTRARHAFRNFLLGVLNSLLISLLFVSLWLWAAEKAEAWSFGLFYWVQTPGSVHMLGSLLLFDLWTYWWHRMNHEVRFFWRFHRVHHSDAQMDVTTSTRFHLGEICISSLLRVPLILLIGAKLWHLALYEVVMFPIVMFHHANVALPPWLDRTLRVFIVTPDMHKVHHSRWQPETDSNYTSMLSVWDRLFGTFRLRKNPHEIAFGLDGYDGDRKQTVAGMLKTPLDKKAAPSSPPGGEDRGEGE